MPLFFASLQTKYAGICEESAKGSEYTLGNLVIISIVSFVESAISEWFVPIKLAIFFAYSPSLKPLRSLFNSGKATVKVVIGFLFCNCKSL